MFKLDSGLGYLQNNGVDVMAFDDFYPEGHQSGVSIIMHGNRVASNGDLRFIHSTEGWPHLPKQKERVLDDTNDTITASMQFSNNEKFINYKVNTRAKGEAVVITVDLESPVPEGCKMGFTLEFFPGALFGKPWMMSQQRTEKE